MTLQRGDDPRVVPIGRRAREVPLVAAIVAISLLIALVKPWGAAPAASAHPSPRTPGATATPSPVALASPSFVVVDPAADWCYAGDSWRLLTIQEDYGRDSHAWLPVTVSTRASGPADPAVPVTPVRTQRALGLGFCTPYRATAVALRRVTAWRLDRFGLASPVALSSITTDLSDPDHGDLFAPPASASLRGSWAAGTYVFAIDSRDPASPRDWFAVDLQIDPLR